MQKKANPMKLLSVIAVLLNIFTSCYSQSSTVCQNCDWHRSVQYKNGTDTLIVKGTFDEIGPKTI